MLKPKLAALFEEYADSHRHPTNRLTHKIAIPAIVFHILAMLDWVKLPVPFPGIEGYFLSLGHVFYALSIVYYLSLDAKLAVIMAALYAPCFPLAHVTPWWAVLVVTVVGWTVQLAGHVVWEKKSPAFLRNLLQALIGPLFFVAILTGDWPARTAPAKADPTPAS